MIKKCLICNKEFKTSPSRILVGRGKYCSRECQCISRKGHTPWNKGKLGLVRWTPERYILMKQKTTGQKRSEETKNKIRLCKLGKHQLGHSGAKHHNWKGGITPINKLIRHSLEYRLWREAVFKRDNYTCIWCGARSGKGKTVILHPDHIKQFAFYPELRFAIDNGRTLCIECHEKTDTYKKQRQ
jgi:hypothetical protein